MLSALGDAVHVLPVLNALRRAWPESRVTWIIQPVAHALVREHPAVDDFIVFRRRRGFDAWRSYAELKSDMHGRRFDMAIALQVYFKAGLITAMTPAKTKLGFDRARARDLNWLFTNRKIPPRPVAHVQDAYFEFLDVLGIDPHPVEWKIGPTESERGAQAAFFERFARPVCAFVVATSKREKNWAPENYVPVIEAVENDFGMRAVIVGGPSRIEREAAEHIAHHARTKPMIALGNDVRRLVWQLDGSALVVSPDTGPLHIARALDVPVVGLYGYTNPKRYGPYRKFTDLVVDGYARFPGEDYPLSMEHRLDGMTRVRPEEVIQKVGLALEQYPV
jgi:heptosyltransferase I